jgi:CubicO group peptidase (beta-lactamase class C family)
MRERFILFLLFISSFSGAGLAAAQTNSGLADILPSVLDSAAVPGMSIAIVEDGSVSWTRGFGVRSTITRPAVDSSTVFEAGSLSKPVFAYLVLKLVDQGKLELDRPLAEYLPYEDVATDERYLSITARMVMDHSTGFPNWRPPNGPLTILFQPGTQFSYSGEGYMYLQRVVEDITRMKLRALSQIYVFDPLEMTQSSFVWKKAFDPFVAAGHDTGGKALDKFTPEEGAAAFSLQTTAPDFAKFMVAVARGEGLSDESAAALRAPQIDAGDGVYWGLGWGIEFDSGTEYLWHWGDNSGFKAFCTITSDGGRGMVYFTNSDNGMLPLARITLLTLNLPLKAVEWLNYEQYDDPQYQLGKDVLASINEKGIDAGFVRYNDLRSELPPAAFEEESLNTLGYKLLRAGRTKEAIEVFKWNTTEFPNAYNAFDSLGEAYLAAGDLGRALDAYRRSVVLEPGNLNGVQMMRQIRASLERK